MNESDYKNYKHLLDCLFKYNIKHVAISLDDYWPIIGAHCNLFNFNPCTVVDLLIKGYQGSFDQYQISLWINKEIIPGHISLSIKNQPKTNRDGSWLSPFKVTDVEKIIKLKAFW